MVSTLDLRKELENLKKRYACELETMKSRIEEAEGLLQRGKVYQSGAFNMAATASELATLAGKIEQTENFIRWTAEKAEV